MIERLTTLDLAQMERLLVESQREGFRFLARLRDEWSSGANRFDKPGEALFGLFDGRELVGIGGVNRLDGLTGRIRRFYILPSHRRQGLGGCLLRHILNYAANHFRYVVLRTDTESGDCFYRACGFTRIRDSRDPTHRMQLAGAGPDRRCDVDRRTMNP
jgi:GNAT superfamily N-acetyltransferase